MSRSGMSPEQPPPARPQSSARPGMSDELVALLRERVASRFYEQPRVVDVIARRLLQLGSS